MPILCILYFNIKETADIMLHLNTNLKYCSNMHCIKHNQQQTLKSITNIMDNLQDSLPVNVPCWELVGEIKLRGTCGVPLIYSCGKGPLGPLYRRQTIRWQTKYMAPITKSERIIPITGPIALLWDWNSFIEALVNSAGENAECCHRRYFKIKPIDK